jgi:hypothetical protein
MTNAVLEPVDTSLELDEKCIACEEVAAGRCESCNAPLCADHDSGEYDDVMTCSDLHACEARIISGSHQ